MAHNVIIPPAINRGDRPDRVGLKGLRRLVGWRVSNIISFHLHGQPPCPPTVLCRSSRLSPEAEITSELSERLQ